MNIDGAIININFIAPNSVEELLAGEDPARALHQELEKLELRWSNVNLSPAAPHTVRFAIELDVAYTQHTRYMRWPSPAQDSLHASDQLRDGKRLHDVVVCTGGQSSDAIALLDPSCEHDDRQI
jgi:hypothetical protein